MAIPNLKLDELTVDEKLELIEEIKLDLFRRGEDARVPEWHLEILAERERLIEEGKMEFEDFDVFEERWRKQFP